MTDEDTKFWIYAGGLPYELTEGDIVCVFSQYGEIFEISLSRDRDTGKSRGFCFIKYEDHRSCELAVDNFHGATIIGRKIKVSYANNTNAVKSRKPALVAPNQVIERNSPKLAADNKKRKYDETEGYSKTDERKDRRHRRDSKDRGHRRDSKDRGHRRDSKDRGHRHDSKDRGHRRDSKDRGHRHDSKDRVHRHDSKDRGHCHDSKDRGHRHDSKDRGHRHESKPEGRSRHRDSHCKHRHRE